jgi:tRNA(Ile)-lysidine synthase
MEKEFIRSLQQIFPEQLPKKIAVAVSGGLDSMALLALLKNTLDEKTKIFCLTVDHKIRKNSYQDALFVEKFCQENSINCAILESYLKNKPEVDIEGSLREVRYNLLSQFCQKNKIKYLFVAHHNQDLAENFLIRLFRGSGIDGLAAMDKNLQLTTCNLQLIRPLLDFSKSDLKKYLQAKKIKWVEDETNQDEKYLRNKIRKFLQTMPDYEVINSRVALASNAILEAKNILEKETKKNFPRIFKACLSPRHPNASRDPSLQNVDSGFRRNETHGKNDVKKSLILDIEKFIKLEKSTATRYLALALIQVSNRIYKPRLKKLERIYNLIIEDKMNKKEEFYGCFLQKITDKKIIITQK